MSRRLGVYKICGRCCATFYVKWSHAAETWCCSRRCSQEVRRGRAMALKRRTTVRICAVCRAAFVAEAKNRKHCSRACYWASPESAEVKRQIRARGGYSPVTPGSRDANEPEIVEALRKAGAWVRQMVSAEGPGLPDLLVSRPDGSLVAMEVKNPMTWYGRNGLSPSQQRWWDEWADVPKFVVNSPAEALAAIGVK